MAFPQSLCCVFYSDMFDQNPAPFKLQRLFETLDVFDRQI